MTEQLSTLAELTLYEGYKIVFEAIDPTTGATVTGVTVSNVAIAGEDVSTPPGVENPSIGAVAPLFTPLPIDPPPDTAAGT